MSNINIKEDVITDLFNCNHQVDENIDFNLENCGCCFNQELDDLGLNINNVFVILNKLNNNFGKTNNKLLEKYDELDDKMKGDIENG